MRIPSVIFPALAGVFFWCLAATPALAHRVNVFTYVEGDTVHVECSYSRSDRVRLGTITVRNAATGQVYLTGKTDEKGNFAFNVPESTRKDKADLVIQLNAGEGHQNEETVKAAEYLTAAPATGADMTPQKNMPSAVPPASTPAAATPAGPIVPTTVVQPVVPVTGAPAAGLDQAALRAVVEQAVETKIAPIRKMLLDEKEKGPGLAEIAGGIGWLVGIAGLLAYVRCHKGGRGA